MTSPSRPAPSAPCGSLPDARSAFRPRPRVRLRAGSRWLLPAGAATAAIAVAGVLLSPSRPALATAAARTAVDEVRIHPAAALPAETLATVVIRDGAGLVADLRAAWTERLGDGPLGELVAAIPNLGPARLALLGIAADAASDPWSVAGALLGQRLAVGLLPPADAVGAADGSEDARPVLIARAGADRAAIRDRVIASIGKLTGARRGNAWVDGRTEAHAGGQVIDLAPGVAVGLRGPHLIVARDAELVAGAMSRLERLAGAGDDAEGTAAARTLAARIARVPEGATVWLSLSEPFEQLLAQRLPSRVQEPLPAIMAGGWIDALRSMQDGLAWASLEEDGLRVTMDAKRSRPRGLAHAGFLAAVSPDGRTFDATAIPGYLSSIDLPRDLAAIVANRESLMSLEASSSLVETINGLSALMGNFDVLEEIFDRGAGPIRFVTAARPAGGDLRRPVPELPAMALVMPLEDLDRDFAARVRSGALAAMGLVNIERQQMSQPGLIVDTEGRGDARSVVGRFPLPRDSGAPLGIEHNFAPAVGLAGDQLVVASDADLLRAIVAADAGAVTSTPRDRFHVAGRTLTDLLERNRETLIAGRMVEQGERRAQAETFVSRLLAGLGLLEDLGAEVEADDDGFMATVRLRLRTVPAMPAAAAATAAAAGAAGAFVTAGGAFR